MDGRRQISMGLGQLTKSTHTGGDPSIQLGEYHLEREIKGVKTSR
jgi:hypothetical protein